MITRNVKVADPFFSPGEGSEWNACIGIQGDKENYIEGYIEAALELAGAVIDKEQHGKLDTLAMPILYNARHGIELCLKFVIDSLREAGFKIGDSPRDHDIRAQWTQIVAAQVGDSDLRNYLSNLEKYVDSLHSVDNDGQQLRYFETVKGEKSLSDKSICNLLVIRQSLNDLRQIVIAVKRRATQLIRERETGTYTSKCSRRDLMRITKMLPDRSQWREPQFAAAKAEVMRDFGLTGRKFCEAAIAIQKNREMAGILGVESSLEFLTDEHAMYAIGEWSKLHPPRSPKDDVSLLTGVRMRDLVDHIESEEAAVNGVLSKLSAVEVAELQTVFYLGRESWYCETYANELALARRRLVSPDELRMTTSHILSKTNFVEDFANGLDILGRRQFASTVRNVRPDLFPPPRIREAAT